MGGGADTLIMAKINIREREGEFIIDKYERVGVGINPQI